jgi:hypothetical protein
MRVLSALTASTSELLHKLIHYCIIQSLQGVHLVLVCHSGHSVLKEVNLQHRVGVQVIVHVQLLHGSSRLFFRGVRQGRLSQRSGVSLTVSGDFLYAPDDITVLGAYLLQLLLVYL